MVAFALMLASLVGWVLVSRAPVGPVASEVDEPQLLSYIPSDAFVVAVIDVAALRSTALGERFLGRGRTIAGIGEVAELCGHDPIVGVDQLAIAIPAGEGDGFGVFAVGDIDADSLLSCAERIVVQRGGRPVREPRGRFAVLRDAGQSLSSAELAAAEGGPVLLGEPAYVKASIALADGRGESVASSPAHGSLRGLVEDGAVVATVVFSERQRKMLADELRAQHQSDSPFASIQSAAMSVRIDRDLHVHGVLRCAAPSACEAVAAAIDDMRRQEARSDTALAVGLTPVLTGLRIQAREGAVHLRLQMPTARVLELVSRLLMLRKLVQNDDVVSNPAVSSSATATSPDPGGSPAERRPAQPAERRPAQPAEE